MKAQIAFVANRKQAKHEALDALTKEYVQRASRMAPVESVAFASESALLEEAGRSTSRAKAHLVLFDSRGDMLTSEDFAALLGRWRDAGMARVMCCVGPADGWSKEALGRADRVVALGRMTLPHELARVVVAEQVYRALTILAGHPYHSGH